MSTDQDMSEELHTEAWWMRATEGALSAGEARQWETHLAHCETCRQMRAAMAAVDRRLRTAPPPPPLSADFTQATMARLQRQQQRQRWLVVFASVLIIAIAVWLCGSAFTSTLTTLNHTFRIIIAGRHFLLNALTQTLVGLLVSWRALVPFVAVLVGITGLWLMPNSILATLTLLWISRQRQEITNHI